jgi:exosortase/archaeosortase family protein
MNPFPLTRQTDWRWLSYALAAVITLIPATLAGELPLQQLTAIVANFLLDLVGSSSVSGTIITFNGTEIAVTEDCSGTNTLQALTACLFLWAYINRLSPTLTAVMIYPLVFCSNVLRVLIITALALAGGQELAMGMLHDISGLLAFIIVLLAGTLIQQQVEHRRRGLTQKVPALLFISSITLLAGYFVAGYVSSPVDRSMYPLAAVGFGLLLWQMFQQGRKPSATSPALAFAAAALLFWCLDFGALVGLALVGVLYLQLRRSPVTEPQLLLALSILASTLPGVPLAASSLMQLQPLGACLLLTVMFASLGFLLERTFSRVKPPLYAIAGGSIAAATVCLLLLLPFDMIRQQQEYHSRGYVIGDWIGRDIALTSGEMKLYGDGRTVKREYRNGDTVVWLFQVDTPNRRSIHSPEYCYLSSGWQVELMEPRFQTARAAVHGEAESRHVRYWYHYGGLVFTDRLRLLASGFLRPLFPDTAWRLTRVSAPFETDAAAIDSFIKLLREPTYQAQ